MRSKIAIGCFFLSGVAGLIYEVCWIRRASLVFGSTLFAVSTVLAVFFLGLALGSEVFGRRSRRIAQPLRLYAWLEITLAVLALPVAGQAPVRYPIEAVPTTDKWGGYYGGSFGSLFFLPENIHGPSCRSCP